MRLLIAFVCILLCAGRVQAGSIDDIFCPALSNPETYAKKYKAYERLVPGEDGWIFRTSRDLVSDFSISTQTRTFLKDIQDAFAEKGITFVMLYVPTRGMVHFKYIKQEYRKQFGFTDIDAVWNTYDHVISDTKAEGTNIVGIPKELAGSNFFYKRDHHWNQAGAKIGAKVLAAYIKTLPVYQTLRKTDFKTQEQGPYQFNGASDKVFSKVCGTVQPSETIVKQETVPFKISDREESLFGIEADPEVVLLGTSNSTLEPSFSNFEGFLKEILGTDILNLSVSGGGIDTAMLSYLNSDHYKKGKAKLVIWEVPGYYALDRHIGLFRQAIPAITGNCTHKPVAMKQDIILSENTETVLDKLKDLEVFGHDYYLHFKFSKPIADPFLVDLRYVKDRDKYTLKRSNRYPFDRDFYLALKDSKQTPVEKVVLEIPDTLKGMTVTSSLCKK